MRISDFLAILWTYFSEAYMTFSDIFFIGVGLSMDAFAVSMCQGLSMSRLRFVGALRVALFFGVFQAVMPLLGFALGSTFASWITIGPWIAFGLLLLIGGKMLIDGIRNKQDEPSSEAATIGKLTMLAVATSIDAFAVGVSLSMQEGIVWLRGGLSIFWVVSLIGAITFLLSLIGVYLGHRFGLKYHRAATLLGGIVLILIGIKILLESFGLLPAFMRCDRLASIVNVMHMLFI